MGYGHRELQRLWLGLAGSLLVLCALASAAQAIPSPGQVPGGPALEQVLAGPGLRGAALSVLVVDRASGQELFAHSPDRLLVPASNQKLITATAALAAFGPAHRFVTEVEASSQPDAQGRVARLSVRGSGDPSLTSEQWWRLAADLRALGLREVTDLLTVDDRVFDDERWHASWQPITARAYHAPVGALSANYGAFRVRVAPGARVGEPARITVDPPIPYLQLVRRATTGAPGSAVSLRVDRVAGGSTEQVQVAGSIPVGGEARDVYRSVAHPTRYAAAVLRQQLEANGIRVSATTRRAPMPAGGVALLSFEGFELARVVTLFLKNSNNMIGEALVKALGRGVDGTPGSWPRGLAAVRRILREHGVELGRARLADGSGLSRDNRLSARILVEVLLLADRSFEWAPELLAALPIAGRDGTLKKRAAGVRDRVRAKTGLLTGVTGLSGFARTADGRDLVFSLLANGYRQGDRAAMNQVDRFVAALVSGGPGSASQRGEAQPEQGVEVVVDCVGGAADHDG